MMSSGGGGDSNGGGILRSSSKQKGSGGRGVSFSGRDESRTFAPSRNNTAGDEYDSDEVEDAIMASGDGLSMRRSGNNDSGNMDNDGTVLSALEIEEAKRKRESLYKNR